MRILIGILHGLMAWVLMAVGGFLPQRIRPPLERQAILAACRMYEMGGGIDEGAATLVASWGSDGRAAIARLIDSGKIPRKHAFAAKLLLLAEWES